ncbi:hypothetical protein ACFWZ2_38815 [Streptomyces sp. NPDC059002]|uniref:hypothetical protein n=1 Tax=Streptomyces sp. NPDC059002 TaxID=3346690 RepID=UPI0036A4B298
MATRRIGTAGGGTAMTGGSSADAPEWRRKLLLGGAALLGLVAAYFLAAAIVPRWWAQRIGDAVNGHLWVGVVLGLVIGLVCTVLPLLLLRYAVRRERSKRVRGIAAVGALLLAVPNLCTLAVVVGRGSGARAGRTVLDVKGPMFRGATLWGVIIAVVVFAGLLWLLSSRREGTATDGRAR